TCTAVKRLYLHEEIAGPFLERLKDRIGGFRLGNGLDPSVDMGPLVSRTQREKVAAVVDQVQEMQMGTILTGGCPPPGDAFSHGFFYEPTLITDPEPDAPVLTDEVFGPVLPIMTVSDLDAAIEEANRTRYGLGASIWTKNLDVAQTFFSQVEAGVVWVNRHLNVPPEMPFGGVKESGIGRENGLQAYYAYSRTKSIFMGR
ncbi:MAG TPA: aldehyde dehydrogenase family protein, partial [Methanomicrobiales archaeon]|nr:aldehyde dehydrogenase family protein [Methanomicrobiales archaeon]